MSDCVLVVVLVPAASLAIETLLPTHIPIKEIRIPLFRLLQKQMQSICILDVDSVLYAKRLCCVLRAESSLSEYGICNGDIIAIW